VEINVGFGSGSSHVEQARDGLRVTKRANAVGLPDGRMPLVFRDGILTHLGLRGEGMAQKATRMHVAGREGSRLAIRREPSLTFPGQRAWNGEYPNRREGMMCLFARTRETRGASYQAIDPRGDDDDIDRATHWTMHHIAVGRYCRPDTRPPTRAAELR
jgi:hypothetical protein